MDIADPGHTSFPQQWVLQTKPTNIAHLFLSAPSYLKHFCEHCQCSQCASLRFCVYSATCSALLCTDRPQDEHVGPLVANACKHMRGHIISVFTPLCCGLSGFVVEWQTVWYPTESQHISRLYKNWEVTKFRISLMPGHRQVTSATMTKFLGFGGGLWKNKPWLITNANFWNVNVPTMADFKLPAWCHWFGKMFTWLFWAGDSGLAQSGGMRMVWRACVSVWCIIWVKAPAVLGKIFPPFELSIFWVLKAFLYALVMRADGCWISVLTW